MKKITILFVTANLGTGGVEKSLINLCKALNKNKFEITVLMLCSEKGLSDELPEEVEKIFCCRNKTKSFEKQYSKLAARKYEKLVKLTYDNKANKLVRRIAYYLLLVENFFFKNYVKKLFKGRNFDVVIGFKQGEPSDVAMSAFSANKKIVFYRHGKVFEFMNDKKYYDIADKVIVLSKGVKHELQNKRGVPSQKVEVMHNIFDIDSIKKLSVEVCEADKINKTKMVTVARISKEKGILQAIKAANILKNNGLDFIWYFVGPENSDYLTKCKNVISELNLEKYIVFTGVKNNPYPYYRSADLYIQPSECEALPRAVMEALILNKVVVSTKTYGAIELIDDKKNGVLCGFSPKEIAETIQNTINDKELISNIVNELQKFSDETQSEILKYEDLFVI